MAHNSFQVTEMKVSRDQSKHGESCRIPQRMHIEKEEGFGLLEKRIPARLDIDIVLIHYMEDVVERNIFLTSEDYGF
jgi:hypothetical protein